MLDLAQRAQQAVPASEYLNWNLMDFSDKRLATYARWMSDPTKQSSETTCNVFVCTCMQRNRNYSGRLEHKLTYKGQDDLAKISKIAFQSKHDD